MNGWMYSVVHCGFLKSVVGFIELVKRCRACLLFFFSFSSFFSLSVLDINCPVSKVAMICVSLRICGRSADGIRYSVIP